MEILPVKDTVGKVADPVAQADDPAVVGNANVEGEVTVAEYEVFDGGILFQFLPGKLHLVFPVSSGKSTDGPVFFTAIFRPSLGKSYGSVGMNASIEPLSGPVFEKRLKHPVLPVAVV